MSDSKPLNDWVKDWEALQRQYLGAWSDLMQKVPGGAPPPAPFSTPFGAVPGAFGAAFGVPPAPAPGWREGAEQWSRMFGAKGGAGDTIERMIESSKAYIGMVKSLLGGGAASAMGDGANPAQAWLDAMRGGLGGTHAFQMPGMDGMSGFQMPGADAMSANPFFKAIRDIAGRGAKGFGDLPSSFAPFLEQMGEQFRQQNLSSLRMPAFGLAREHQEHYQRTAVAFIEFQDALRGYNALMLKASQRGLELMEGKLAERSEPGRTIDSPRALYDLWVDAAEEAYAEVALSDEFGKAYGELANAQMRMRAQIQAEVERIGTDLGMPTRSELDSVHQRLHDLRREFRERQHGSASIADLEAEIAALREEVERLKSGAETARLDSNARPASAGAGAASSARAPARRVSRSNVRQVEAQKAEARKVEAARVEARTVASTRSAARKIKAKSFDANRVEPKKVTAKKAGAQKAEMKAAETKKVAAKKAEAKRAETKAAEMKKVAAKEVAAKKAAAKKGAAKKAETKKAEARKAELKAARTKKVAAKKADVKNAEMKKPEARKVRAKNVAAKTAETKAVGAKTARTVAKAAAVAASPASVSAARQQAAAAKPAASARTTAPARAARAKSQGRRRVDRRARAKVASTSRAEPAAAAPTSFGDAIAAMRKRVQRSTKSARLKSVAARFERLQKSAAMKRFPRAADGYAIDKRATNVHGANKLELRGKP